MKAKPSPAQTTPAGLRKSYKHASLKQRYGVAKQLLYQHGLSVAPGRVIVACSALEGFARDVPPVAVPLPMLDLRPSWVRGAEASEGTKAMA